MKGSKGSWGRLYKFGKSKEHVNRAAPRKTQNAEKGSRTLGLTDWVLPECCPKERQNQKAKFGDTTMAKDMPWG